MLRRFHGRYIAHARWLGRHETEHGSSSGKCLAAPVSGAAHTADRIIGSSRSTTAAALSASVKSLWWEIGGAHADHLTQVQPYMAAAASQTRLAFSTIYSLISVVSPSQLISPFCVIGDIFFRCLRERPHIDPAGAFAVTRYRR